jgi:hypothetical protein
MEPRRVRATEVLVSRRVGRREAAEVSWLRENVMGPDQAVWALRITARDRYSDRCWCWGEPLGVALEGAVDRPGGRCNGVMTRDVVWEGQNRSANAGVFPTTDERGRTSAQATRA